ncbi:uncharacterized protein LOC123879329 [Maniola jurtina]|uniref:uncharacterized protein LOC123879329 n=1 Tax=Maniola jurtina TaxID=191418 RepID=UPI001E68D411|nr:uncharacterized protein LOC123879329 [Maniola jurtina]
MKSTTIFVVALTVFSCMFGGSSVEANCAVDDQKCKTILELIEISNKCLDEINDAITDALAKASPEEKDVITNAIVYYMMGFNIIVPEIHAQLTEACNGGSEEEQL